MRSALRSTLQVYRVSFPILTVIGLFFFTQAITQKIASHDPDPWWHYLVSWLIGVYFCALLTPLIFWLGRRFPIERRNWLRHSVLHLLFGVFFSLSEIAIHSTLIYCFGLFPTVMKGFAGALAVLLLIAFHQNILTYWTILGIGYAIRYYQDYQERKQQALRLELQTSELKTQLVQAQLSALNTQLQPHFLFNTLNAIMVLVRQKKTNEAEEMLARLSDLLRCVLEDVNAQEVPLRRELEYVQLYLSIQQVRFQDRLRIEICADPALMNAAVPHLGLQPLVENAIQHGIGQTSSSGKLQISAARIGGTLEIKVCDDGPGLPPAGLQSGRGIGLANTRARLRQLYGDRALLTVESRDPCGTAATVTLPFHLMDSDADTELIELHALNSVDR
jgi:two-component system, LytTR family, sensor kinase